MSPKTSHRNHPNIHLKYHLFFPVLEAAWLSKLTLHPKLSSASQPPRSIHRRARLIFTQNRTIKRSNFIIPTSVLSWLKHQQLKIVSNISHALNRNLQWNNSIKSSGRKFLYNLRHTIFSKGILKLMKMIILLFQKISYPFLILNLPNTRKMHMAQ